MDRLTAHLTSYASGLAYADLPPEVVDATKRIILDSVGCALGAARAEPAAIARAVALEVTARHPATLMVTGERTSADLAAFVNGVLVRYQDFSDADQDRKLRAMARDQAGLPDSRIHQLLERLRRLEQVEDVGALLALTAAGERDGQSSASG